LLTASKSALDDQIEAYGEVYRKVEEVSEQPPTSSFLNDINPFTTDTDRAINEYYTSASNNVAAYQAYNEQSSGNGARMPVSYPAVEAGNVPPVTVRQPDGYTTRAGARLGDRESLSRAVPGSVTKDLPLPAQVADQSGHQTSVVPTAVGGATHHQSTTRDVVSGVPGVSSGTPGEQRTRTGVVTTGASGCDFGPAGTRSGGVADRRGRGTPEWVGGRGSGSGMPSGRAVGSGRPEGGLRSGRGVVDPYWAAARGTIPVTSGAAGDGGPLMGFGNGSSHGDGDAEHERKYLLDLDPASLFGSDEMVAPAVIGVDGNEDED
jgi:hypothetical protein